MSALSIETGTLLQLVTLGAGIAVVWSQMREALVEMRANNAQMREAVTELRAHRDTDRVKLSELATDNADLRARMKTVEKILSVRHRDHDTDPPTSDEDERG